MFNRQYGPFKIHSSSEAVALIAKATSFTFGAVTVAGSAILVSGGIFILAEIENHKPYGGLTESYSSMAMVCSPAIVTTLVAAGAVIVNGLIIYNSMSYFINGEDSYRGLDHHHDFVNHPHDH